MKHIFDLCTMTSNYMGSGELFISHNKRQTIILQDGILSEVDIGDSQGLSLRNINKDKVYFYSSSNISPDHMKSTILPKVKIFVDSSRSSSIENSINLPQGTHERTLYPNLLQEDTLAQRIELLKEIDAYLRSFPIVKHTNIRQNCSHSHIYIYSSNGLISDERPLFALVIDVTIEKDGKYESVHSAFSQRNLYAVIKHNWKSLCDKLIAKCHTISQGVKFPGGKMSVILGSGIPATLLHEAIGHGLEADFNYKNSSVFSDKMGTQIASDLVTVVDDGTIPNSRGTTNFDDEGNPTQRTVLVENGILKSYMFDKFNAIQMNCKSTGNGRRQSYEHQPMPRMTNTIMLNGKSTLEEMISSVDYGIYAVDFGAGQVNITSGQFAFNGAEVYLIKDGKIQHPLNRCVISGMGSEVMKNIIAVGNDFAMDPSGGTCGKNGQAVPVNLGQPSLLIDRMIVG